MTEVLSKLTNKYQAVAKSTRLQALVEDKNFLPIYASSNAKVYPYQIASARFALRSEYLKGCILCDEGSLGKTYEALLIAGQKWYEGKENILVVLPSNLIPQWLGKLNKDFTLPHIFWNNTPQIPDEEGIVITTYDVALKYSDRIKERVWDMVVFDEADCLSKPDKQLTQTLKDSVREAYKLLLTPTPITMDIRDIYGLIHFIDESVLPDADEFYKRYFRKPENYPELTSWVSQFCFRTLKAQACEYVSFSNRIPFTVDYPLIKEEKELYTLLNTYIKSENKVAYEMDEYNLALMLFNKLSSSPQAFTKMLQPAIQRTYGIEKAVLQKIYDLASSIQVNSKTLSLIKIMKQVFNHLKYCKASQKAIVFVTSNTTLDVLYNILRKEGFNTLKYKDNNTLEQFRNDDEIQILVTTDASAKGLDIEYCPVVVNYDLLYNSIEMEQRICRCHRQGQRSDVLVINMLSKDNLADVRMLELINKRTLQFNGIFGMSDDIVGNFDLKLKEVLQQFRPIAEVAESFKQNLETHKTSNTEIVENTENILFTTFTKSIADKVTITPKYIEEQKEQLNNDLWELVKYYFLNIKPDWYEINDNDRTLKLIEGYGRPYLFSYKEDNLARHKAYEGYSEYGMNADFKPSFKRITFTSLLVKGILKELDKIDTSQAILYVDSEIEPCEIGLYNYSITTSQLGSNKMFQHILIGQTQSGKILSDVECRKLLDLPVVKIEEKDKFCHPEFKLFDDFEEAGNLDNKVIADDILRDYFKNKEGSIAYEVERIKLQAGRQKAKLETDLNDLKTEVKELNKQLSNKMTDRLEELKVTKRLRVIEKELKQKEENLFFAQAQVDVETEKKIEELTNSYNFQVHTSCKFKLRLYPNA
ncbi:MAG: DEAD/DEAH box helicase [Candidatus Gastranaerophilales bacterium]|nr:DEAD/DEAH box helicase [Candidatus Gastranaerophilales bacterium]